MQDDAIASSWFWSKIDFSEEKCYGKCLEEHFWASIFQNFLRRGGGSLPPAPLSGLRLQRSKLASSCSEVWLRPCFAVASTFASNPSWFNWAVFLGQKLATLGKDVAPNRCFTIRYSCISFARSLLGHHTNLFLDLRSVTIFWVHHELVKLAFMSPTTSDVCPNFAAQSWTSLAFAELLGMLYWVVREVPHWFIPCVQLFLKNSFCMSSFYVVVYCRPLLPRQFFILHKTPLQKQSSSLCHHLVVEFVR